ncbi:MAG: sel1 repeat family protein [Clostridia bacterium]|nr:sel1 repeat family protein [Clostridia bacterium]
MTKTNSMDTFGKSDKQQENKMTFEQALESIDRCVYPVGWQEDGILNFKEIVAPFEKEACTAQKGGEKEVGTLYYEFAKQNETNAKAVASALEYKMEHYLSKGHANGDLQCTFLLGKLFDNKKGTCYNQNKAIEYFTKAVNGGIVEANLHLGNIYFDRGENHNADLARKYYQQGVQQGNVDCMNALAYLLVRYARDEQDVNQAEQLAKQAIDKGSRVFVPLIMVARYFAGKNTPEFNKKAFDLYEFAVRHNCEAALAPLGEMYQKGIGTTQSFDKAIETYQKGVEKRCEICAEKLGDMYADGSGVENSLDKA